MRVSSTVATRAVNYPKWVMPGNDRIGIIGGLMRRVANGVYRLDGIYANMIVLGYTDRDLGMKLSAVVHGCISALTTKSDYLIYRRLNSQ